jgi:hypothetical protein
MQLVGMLATNQEMYHCYIQYRHNYNKIMA